MLDAAPGVLAEGARYDRSRRGRPASDRWLGRLLRDQGMPSGEVDSVLNADDPIVVRRYFELHRERLEERLAFQLRALRLIEDALRDGEP